ncbi:MAG: AI-2E family transporter [Halieaceae bacterium]|jgi:predicted PurR-regulated permease PerM|nr:AI-2E family transporter [Halieaceae bacterium]
MMRATRSFLGLPLLAVLALLLWLLYALSPILTPFVAGALVAYLGDPATDWLEERGMGRSLAASTVFLAIGLLLLGACLIILPLLISQLNTLVRGIPVAYEWVTGTVLPWVWNLLDLPPETVPSLQVKSTLAEHWQSVGKLVAAVGAYVTDSSVNFLVSLGNLVLVPVVAFYLLRDWDKLTPKVLDLLPEDWQPRGVALAGECDEVIGAFLRGQLLVMLALAIIYSVGLMIVGIDLGVAIGVFAGLFAIVPYLGTAVGILAASVAAWVQFGDWTALVGVAVVFSVAQMIESYLLTPVLVGDRIGLHPVAVIFAVLAGGQLAGFVGVLVGLPVAAVVAVLLRHVNDYYKATEFYTSGSDDGSAA